MHQFLLYARRFVRGAGWRWLVRAVIVWIIIWRLTPVPPRAPLDTPQTVETDHPVVCVHTRLIDEVYEWKIQRSLQMVREMGADTIVEFFPWAYAEPEKGQYSWDSFDRIVKHARNQGLHIIARMGLVPLWARKDPIGNLTNSTLNTLPDYSYDDFAQFVATFAARYAGVIDQIIIWNEPNLAFEWGYRQVSPADYAHLLKTVYAPAHAANSKWALFWLRRLAPTLEPRGSPNDLNDLLYLQGLYEAGATPYFDALAMHTYGFTQPPDAAADPNTLNFRRAELLHEIMVENGDADKAVYITESGWNDNPRWTLAVRPSQRVAYTVEAFQYAEQNWPWLKKLCVWALRYPVNTRSYPDNFTLITPDFEPKPIYNAIQAYARGWQQSEDLWLPAPGE